MADRKPAKRIIRDKKKRPVAVQISYGDWVLIEAVLRKANGRPKKAARAADLNKFRGAIKLKGDPLAYQRAIRAEWP